MAADYKSEEISVTVTATTIDPNFDIEKLSILPVDGDILFRIKDESGWGDWIPVSSGIAFDEDFPCNKIQIKSATGTVTVQYFLKGER